MSQLLKGLYPDAEEDDADDTTLEGAPIPGAMELHLRVTDRDVLAELVHGARASVGQRVVDLVVQQPHLAREAEQHLALRGRPAGGGALDHHPSELRLQRPDALRDRGR